MDIKENVCYQLVAAEIDLKEKESHVAIQHTKAKTFVWVIGITWLNQ